MATDFNRDDDDFFLHTRQDVTGFVDRVFGGFFSADDLDKR
jgi:hypothetical protein